MKVFDDVRDHKKELALNKMRQNNYKVFLDIDEDEPFGQKSKSFKSKYGVDELMKILFEEIKEFKQKEEMK